MNIQTKFDANPAPIQIIDGLTDTRDVLAHARKNALKRGLADWFICDVDAHHVESISWHEVVKYIEDPVIRDNAMRFHSERTGAPPYGLNGDLGLRYTSVGGRIPHQDERREKIPDTGVHRDVELTRRAMDSIGVDNMVIFPTPMLFLGMHPQPEMEVWLTRAYNRWLIDRILSEDDRIKTLLCLPFNTPKEAERTVAEFADKKGVIGFCVPSTRYKPVHHNDYMRLYSMIEETGKPLAFHAGYHWHDPSLATVNRFIGMHALGFVWCNMVHMTNWILNGIPERFPKLKPIWVESGLAWVPFMMQRLDDQYLMRQSEAPQLKRLPSEYMRDNCWYTTQPMETTHPKALQNTLEMINAETQLLFASDWPHFDFDLPQMIYDLPYLSEQAKRNILGLNAARIFNLEPTIRKNLMY
ncbi:amidohydrolase family protein [Caulobacter sp. S45]|jgi:predicted TIM-barrel fold metal-dependent hydrolase|uniref:amidohydrolase family protein n=1 Tax=Caulobacter sp. S45 TaxID=1641861 RepID=UPI00131CBD92|nr:amidohydrolase family protein [Caulobacter sp. S45]